MDALTGPCYHPLVFAIGFLFTKGRELTKAVNCDLLFATVLHS